MRHLQPRARQRSDRRCGPACISAAVAAAGFLMASGLPPASAEELQASPPVKVAKSPVSRQKPGEGIDFANAVPMPLPEGTLQPAPWPELALSPQQQAPRLAPPSARSGAAGSGALAPLTLVPEAETPEESTPDRGAASDVVAPQQFGTQGLPYTTSQVNAFNDDTDVHYPFSTAGKVFFNNSQGQTFVCSASLVGRGVVITAAHCVADFGSRQFFSNWQFVPAYNNGRAPFGVASARQAFVMPSWFDGTDPCAGGPGIACINDVAIVTLNPTGGAFIGSSTGWLGIGANWYGFTPSGATQITQLGYPVALDGGALMERNDAFGYVDPNLGSNTIIGSLMTGGSSGGPWVLNLGIPPSLSGIPFGQAPAPNVVIGVTSWGVVSPDDVKMQAASPFVSGNVFALLGAACTATPAACQ